MAEQWELICHHTYGGVPGVVLDRSQKRSGHGTAVGLVDGDFLYDGVTPGSGAVRFQSAEARIDVPVGAENATAWRPIMGVRGEVTLRRDVRPAGLPQIDTLIDGDTFAFYVRSDALVAWFRGVPTQYAEIVSTFDPIGQPYQVPIARWITVGFMHDGFGTMELYADGQTVARREGLLTPVAGIATGVVTIGNRQTNNYPLFGELDELKIWRLNPDRYDEAFFERPMDAATADCWARLQRELRAAFDRHPECAERLLGGLWNALLNLRRQIVSQGPESKRRLERAQMDYAQLWREGKVDSPEMVKVFGDLITWLNAIGIDPNANPDLQALRESECWRQVLTEISVPDCDPKAMALVQSIAGLLGYQEPAEPAKG
jgi:hypothetical protein